MRLGRGTFAIAVIGLLGVTLGACSASTHSASAPSGPSGGPVPIGQLIANSHKEGGLIVYGNVPPQYFQPLITAFNKVYPWIKVQETDTGDAAAFSKYESEHAQGARSADLIVATSPPLWLQAASQGVLAKVTPSGLNNFPAIVNQGNGIFVMSYEPNVIVYSKKRLSPSEYPTSWASLVADTKADPGKFKSITLDMTNNLGYATVYGLQHALGQSTWQNDLAVIGPNAKTFSESLDALTSILQGGGSVGWIGSGLSQSVLKGFSQLLSYGFMSDGTPLIPRGIGVTAGASSPNSAQLLLDFIYSPSGQDALCQAGFEATMNNFSPPSGCTASLSYLKTVVPPSSLYFVPFSSDLATQQQSITATYNKALKG